MNIVKVKFKSVLFAFPAVRTVGQVLRKLWKNRWYLSAIARDIINTQRSAQFLRKVVASDDRRVVTLLALDDDSINTIKQMAFVSQALRLRGWTVHVVFRNRSTVMGWLYFRAFGIRRFLYLESHSLTAHERAICQRRAKELLARPLSLQTIKGWTFEGCWIGPQIIATLSRIRFEGSVEFNHPEVRRHVKGVLTQALEYVLRAHKLFDKHPTDLAITNEANYTAFGPLVDAVIGRGCNVIQVIQPWRDDALTCRRLTSATRREHPSSVARNTLDRLAGRHWTELEQNILDQMFKDRYGGRWFLQNRNQRGVRYYGSDELAQRFGLDPKRPTAVVFSQVLWDANLFYGDDLFEDAGEWFVETVRAACGNPEVNWLIKLHPANVWKRKYERITQEYAELALIKKNIGSLPEHVRLIEADDDISTLSLFEFADYGVTLRGTSGMELACFGKFCVTAGTGRYSGLGFTLDSDCREQYLERLANLHLQAPMSSEEILRAKWHAFASFVLRPWKMISATAEYKYLETGSGPFDHNLTLAVSSVEEIEANNDLRKWGDWAVGEDVDYLEIQDNLKERTIFLGTGKNLSGLISGKESE